VRNRLWIVGLLVAAAVVPLSAAPASNRLGLGFGLAYMELRDDLVVPLSFIGPHLSPLQISYNRRTDCDWLSFDAGIGLAPLFDRYGFLIAVFPLEAGGQYLTRIACDRAGGSILLGAQARWSMDANMAEYWDSEHNYWLTAIGLAPTIGYTRPIRQNQRLDAALAITGAAFVSRPPLHRYTKNEPSDPGFLFRKCHENLRFASLDKYQAVRLLVAWTRPFAKTDFTVAYQGRFARADWPRPVMVLEHSINLSWGIRL
jgi:hypothetical protein